VPDDIRAAATIASTDAFHLAALVGAVLLALGALVNWIGLSAGPTDHSAGRGSGEEGPTPVT
jgi:hypothetical protein